MEGGEVKRNPLRRTGFKSNKIAPGVKGKRRTRIKQIGARKKRELEACKEFSRKFMAEYTCDGCGARFPNHQIQAHHLVPRSRAPGHALLHDKRNRLWLHTECHNDAHSGRRPDLIKPLTFLDSLTKE